MTSRWTLVLTGLLVAIAFSSQKSFAWGTVGHEAVAMIADQNLDAGVKRKIADVLQGDTLVMAATWPDKVKHTGPWAHTAPYHFADMGDSQSYLDMVDSLPAKSKKTGDIIRALLKCEDVMRDSNSSLDQQKYALSFMVHLMGDLHQPLHEGRPEDRGGNDIEAQYFGVKTNLHSVWDKYIIENILKAATPAGFNTHLVADVASGFSIFQISPDANRKPPAKGTKDDTGAFVEQIRTPSNSEVASWQDSFLIDWSTDSIELRSDIYGNWKGSNAAGYQKKYADYLNEKVLRAGYRLAAWLNAIYSGQEFQADKAADLRQHLAQSIGQNYAESVSVEPTKNLTMTAELSLLSSKFDNDDD